MNGDFEEREKAKLVRRVLTEKLNIQKVIVGTKVLIKVLGGKN